MNYQAYPTRKTMPRRKQRKSERNRVYWHNYTLARTIRKEKKGV